MIASRSMAENLLNEKKATASSEPCTNYLIEKVFGASKEKRKYNLSDFNREASGSTDYITKVEPHVSTLCSSTVREIRQTVSNFVSFSASMVDQCQWERTSAISVDNESDPPSCDANLFALVKHYVGTIVTTVFMGGAFTENFQNVVPDMWLFNSRFNAMLMGIPRFVPGPGLLPAYSARLRLIQTLTVFHTAFAATEGGTDPGFEWRDLEDGDLSEFMQGRARAWIKSGVSPESAAPEDLAVLWALNIKLGTLVFWNIIRILADDDLRTAVLKEIAPYARSSRPDSKETGFHIQEPPRLSLNLEGLLTSCPLFRATVWETIRLHTASFTYRKLRSDVTLVESEKDAELAKHVGGAHPYCLRAGEYVCVPQSVLNTHPAYFSDPEEFDPRRFQRGSPDEEKPSSDPSAPRQEGNTTTSSAALPKLELDGMPPFTGADDQLSEQLVMMFTAAVLATWDIQPVGSKSWKVPKRKLGSLVFGPARDVRVRMKYRA